MLYGLAAAVAAPIVLSTAKAGAGAAKADAQPHGDEARRKPCKAQRPKEPSPPSAHRHAAAQRRHPGRWWALPRRSRRRPNLCRRRMVGRGPLEQGAQPALRYSTPRWARARPRRVQRQRSQLGQDTRSRGRHLDGGPPPRHSPPGARGGAHAGRKRPRDGREFNHGPLSEPEIYRI